MKGEVVRKVRKSYRIDQGLVTAMKKEISRRRMAGQFSYNETDLIEGAVFAYLEAGKPKRKGAKRGGAIQGSKEKGSNSPGGGDTGPAGA